MKKREGASNECAIGFKLADIRLIQFEPLVSGVCQGILSEWNHAKVLTLSVLGRRVSVGAYMTRNGR